MLFSLMKHNIYPTENNIFDSFSKYYHEAFTISGPFIGMRSNNSS